MSLYEKLRLKVPLAAAVGAYVRPSAHPVPLLMLLHVNELAPTLALQPLGREPRLLLPLLEMARPLATLPSLVVKSTVTGWLAPESTVTVPEGVTAPLTVSCTVEAYGRLSVPMAAVPALLV